MCPQPCSVQLADLKAVTVACKLENGKSAEIYTDSTYVHIWSSVETEKV